MYQISYEEMKQKEFLRDKIGDSKDVVTGSDVFGELEVSLTVVWTWVWVMEGLVGNKQEM